MLLVAIIYESTTDFHLEPIGTQWRDAEDPVQFYIHFQSNREYAYWTRSNGMLPPDEAAEETEDMISGGYPGFEVSVFRSRSDSILSPLYRIPTGEPPSERLFNPIIGQALDFSVRPMTLHGSGWGAELTHPFLKMISP